MLDCAVGCSTTDLYELCLLATVPGLESEGSVAVERTGGLHPHLRLLVDTLPGESLRHVGPAGGEQDVDSVNVGPALGRVVQHLATLISTSVSSLPSYNPHFTSVIQDLILWIISLLLLSTFKLKVDFQLLKPTWYIGTDGDQQILVRFSFSVIVKSQRKY